MDGVTFIQVFTFLSLLRKVEYQKIATLFMQR